MSAGETDTSHFPLESRRGFGALTRVLGLGLVLQVDWVDTRLPTGSGPRRSLGRNQMDG